MKDINFPIKNGDFSIANVELPKRYILQLTHEVIKFATSLDVLGGIAKVGGFHPFSQQTNIPLLLS